MNRRQEAYADKPDRLTPKEQPPGELIFDDSTPVSGRFIQKDGLPRLVPSVIRFVLSSPE
jgi:hypothetical protein